MMPGPGAKRADLHEFNEEVGTLTAAFAARGMSLDARLWDDAAEYAAEYDALLPLLVWDYFEGNEARFLSTMERASQITPVFNNPATLKWNADKAYLAELAANGAPVIPTVTVSGVMPDDADRAFARFGTDRLVIKPQVGGGAYRQVLLGRNDPWPHADDLPLDDALIQPFLPSVQEEGEYTLLFFDGEFSHGLQKLAKSGDYRIQSQYGDREVPWIPDEEALRVARDVLGSLPETPLYARVDLLRGLDGKLALIELEMIEPYLYLPLAEVGADGLNRGALMLADALKARLT